MTTKKKCKDEVMLTRNREEPRAENKSERERRAFSVWKESGSYATLLEGHGDEKD
jgi:hypothetical protein